MRTLVLFLITAWISIPYTNSAQSGCTDPQALNYNPDAVVNDGSCEYPQTVLTPVFQTEISHELNEISGLTQAHGAWWTHNDSGNSSQFFELDPQTGAIPRTIELDGATNEDWEDVAADSAFLYLGDFGNNRNNRENLGIYRIPFSSISDDNQQTINSSAYSFIPFAYPDQQDFSTIPEDSATYDCEAMFWLQGKLHLFTKNHRDYTTTHYSLDLQTQQVEKLETLNSAGMITGADVSPDGKTIALVGYNLHGLPTVFCWLLRDWQPGSGLFFSGNKRRIEFGSALSVGQVESIGFIDNRKAYIANEITEYMGFVLVQPGTRIVDFSPFLPEENAAVGEPGRRNTFEATPNPVHSTVEIRWPVETGRPILIQLFDNQGNMHLEHNSAEPRLDLSSCPPGCYTLRAIWEDGSSASRHIIRQ